jgi:hypothetical protein
MTSLLTSSVELSDGETILGIALERKSDKERGRVRMGRREINVFCPTIFGGAQEIENSSF